jgi:hypothetical protein
VPELGISRQILGWTGGESRGEFGGRIAGHLIGQSPDERIADDKVTLYVHPNSHLPMRSVDEKGQKRHWILENHFVNREHEIGGFLNSCCRCSHHFDTL